MSLLGSGVSWSLSQVTLGGVGGGRIIPGIIFYTHIHTEGQDCSIHEEQQRTRAGADYGLGPVFDQTSTLLIAD